MAEIIYKKGMDGQNNLSSIEGIEIDLLNGQKALIFPKYSEEPLLRKDQIDKWNSRSLSEIEALKVEDTVSETAALFMAGSPAANWAFLFVTKDGRQFSLPSLLAAMEIKHHRREIDDLAKTIEGADLLRDFDSCAWSCSRFSTNACWHAIGYGCAGVSNMVYSRLVVPTILYIKENVNIGLLSW